MAVVRLTEEHVPALEELLLEDTPTNLFPLGFLESVPMERAIWFALLGSRGQVRATTLLVPGRLAVPYAADASLLAVIGGHFHGRVRPCMLVGPREASDILWQSWTRGAVETDRFYDQRLYVCSTSPPRSHVDGFRLADAREWRELARNAIQMEIEDVGNDPSHPDPALHAQIVKDRIKAGRTWIIERGNGIVFQINVGVQGPLGCQIGGTYVPKGCRGQGLAKDGVRAVTARLIDQYPNVTLHVNEANTPAVRVYEQCGYERDAAFRLLTVPKLDA